MGGEPWMYVVDFQADISKAMRELCERELLAGRYNPVMRHLPFPVTPESPSAGKWHKTIEEAREAAAEDGTRSILDMDRVGPDPDFGVVVQVDEATLKELYGTPRPTRQMVESNPDFLDEVERGHGVYIVLYEQGMPTGLCFAGYSYD